MNPLPFALWNQGLSYAAYRAAATKNLEVFDQAYAHPGHTAEDLAFLRALPPLRVVAIGEDWCPDVFHTLPTWVRIVEELPGWELKVFPRDAHPALMDTFLWERTSRRVPVYAFYSANGLLQVWWSGRGSKAQQAIDGLLAGRSYDDLPSEEKRQGGLLMSEGYPREFRRANLDEILSLLAAFYHRR